SVEDGRGAVAHAHGGDASDRGLPLEVALEVVRVEPFRSEEGVHPLAVGHRGGGREARLAVPAVVGRALVGHLFPEDLAGLRVHRQHPNLCLWSAPTASGCTNSLPSSMCGAALAPATTSPSTAVVRKIVWSHTTGDECPRPGISVFQAMFLDS